MERIDSVHSSTSLDEKNPKPILVPHSRKSISGIDILNGLKIMTNTYSSSDSMPNSPIPQQLISEHPFSQIDDFELKEAIGYGSSAIVYKALYKPFNKRLALKMIDLDKFERNQIDELRRETALMALSKHANVLRVYGSFVSGSKLYIVTPYLAGGSCLDIMKTRFSEGLDELSIATILKQTLEALIYLHKNGHIHRDIKAGNLLMDDDGTVLVGDFGVSSSLMETGERGMRKTFVGTPCWMAPEVMEQAEYDYKADIWSFGITALELATGHAPFAKFPPLKVLMMTLSNEPPTLDREGSIHKYSKIFKDMIDLCLSKDPLKRPTAEKLLQHPFFKQAKRKDYLVKMILSELPPLEQRPRKKMPTKQVTITKTDEWDFDDDDETDEEVEEHNNIPELVGPAGQQTNNKSSNKKHISFGDVVVRNNSMIHPSDPVNVSASPPRPTLASTPPPTLASTPPNSKKSRFVIEESTDYPMQEEEIPQTDEIMKGRFYVNQPISKQDEEFDRKSRFEIYQPIPLSRESSTYSSSRSVTEKRYPALQPQDLLTTENVALLTESSRKIGRFELTGGSTSSSVDVTPRGSISSSQLLSDQQHHQSNDIMSRHQLEELIRMNESQKNILQELKKVVITDEEEVNNHSSNSAHEYLTSTVDHLNMLIQQTLRENNHLQKENESLRRELKELKATHQ